MKRVIGALAALAIAVFLASGARGQSTLDRLNDELVALANKVSPSVVEIQFEGPPAQAQFGRWQMRNPLGEGQVEIQVAPGQGAVTPILRGSGVIMTPDGYILTAAEHLRGRAEAKAKVTLQDGRMVDAVLVGRDARTGLAVLKVEAKNLPAVELADKQPPVGSLVVAVGDTAGVGKSVSLGLVSGANRTVAGGGMPGSAMQFPNMLQITNPVTPSDVGGLVADLRGRLVGILHSSMTGRSMVAQPMEGAQAGGMVAAGGNVRVFGLGMGGPPQVSNVSFATPVETIRSVFDSLKKGEKVAWGYLGIYYSLEKDQGIAVTQVVPKSPASAAGIREGDVVTSLAAPGKAKLTFTGDAKDAATFSQAIGAAGSGAEVKVALLREGQALEMSVKLGVAPEMPQQNEMVMEQMPDVRAWVQQMEPFMRRPWLGVELEATDAGARVARVMPQSPAERHGLRAGDVITRVAGADVKTPEEVTTEIEKHKPGEKVALALRRDGQAVQAEVELGMQPGRPGGVPPDALQFVLGRQTWLGIEAKDTDEGLLVTRVFPDSPAEKAGMKLNDVIVRADGKDMAALADLRGIVRRHKPDDEMPVTLRREGKEMDLKIKLGNMGSRAPDAVP